MTMTPETLVADIRAREITFSSDLLKPPESNLQIAYVIPIRGEVANGNFFKQIRNFTNQRNTPKDLYEVLYVRNNPDINPKIQRQFIPENQTIADAIAYIQGGNEMMPEDLEEWQQSILANAKKQKLRVRTIEAPITDVKKTHFGDYIEAARIIGENLAKQRFADIKYNGAIVTFDADTRIGVETTSQIREQLLDRPNVGMLTIRYDLDPTPGEGGENLFRTSPAERFVQSMRSLTRIIDGMSKHDWFAIKANSLEEQNPEINALAFFRARLRPTEGEEVQAYGMKIYVQDRHRELGVGGDYGDMRRDTMNPYDIESSINPEFLSHPALSLLVNIYGKHRSNPTLRLQVGTILRRYFQDADWLPQAINLLQKGESLSSLIFRIRINTNLVSFDEVAIITWDIIRSLSGDKRSEFDEIVNRTIREEQVRHTMRLGAIERTFEKAFALPSDQSLTVEAIQTAPGRETEEAHFLRSNPWLLQELKTRRKSVMSREFSWEVVKEKYPEYAEPFEKTTFEKANATLLGVIDFLERNPTIFDESTAA